MVITGLYAGVLALIYIVLSMRVIALRFSNRTPFGDGGNDVLARCVRVHSNFIEYVPIALILMAILDTQFLSPLLLHVLGISLVLGRVLHALALTYNIFAFRVIGVVTTLAVIGIEAILAIIHYVL